MTDITATVLERPHELSVETLQLDDPKADEIQVDLRATGICHTDYHRYVGDTDAPYPLVLGHEGAGVVEQVGANVTTVEPGDHVVLWVLPFCRTCKFCERGEPYLCSSRSVIKEGALFNGTRRLSRDGEPINHFFGQSSFASKCVVAEQTAVRIPEELPFEEAALLGCGATTGLGAIVNTADVTAGEPVAIFGCGGVGASAIMGAAMVNANPIIAIDIVADKLTFVEQLGATHTINSTECDPVAAIMDITDGGVEYAFECISQPPVIEQAIDSLRPGGTAVITGSSSTGPFEVTPGELTSGKRIIGNIGGNVHPHTDIPRFAELNQKGVLNLGELVSRTYSLDEVEDAFEDMESGEIIRGVIQQ